MGRAMSKKPPHIEVALTLSAATLNVIFFALF
jgi:hypothetical protein